MSADLPPKACTRCGRRQADWARTDASAKVARSRVAGCAAARAAHADCGGVAHRRLRRAAAVRRSSASAGGARYPRGRACRSAHGSAPVMGRAVRRHRPRCV
eukprot:366322-Chlamydomonas_euryale.AAC.5